MMVHPDSHGISRVPQYLGEEPRKTLSFRLQGYHLLWPAFQIGSTKIMFFDFPTELHLCPVPSRNLYCTTHAGLTCSRFRLFPFRSPLLRESHWLSFPRGTEMFQFPLLSPSCLCVQQEVSRSGGMGYPIRKSPDLRSFASPRSLSQLTTSFIDFSCQGIHHMPLVT